MRPVSGLHEAADLLGIDVQLINGKMTLITPDGMNTTIVTPFRGHFNFTIRETIKHRCLGHLQSRTTDNTDETKNSFRKDMVGVNNSLDENATMPSFRHSRAYSKGKPDKR